MKTFAKTPITTLLAQLRKQSEQYWIQRGQRRALALFHAMAARVPAYKDFLQKHRIHADLIHTIKDFSQVPTVSKNSYLRVYPREAVCWDGKFSKLPWTISTTSGSTGEPFYFPRSDYQNDQYALTAELYLRTNFQIHKRKTLYIVGFPMGAWIGGVFTLQALEILRKRGNYSLSIITPGINTLEIVKAVQNLGPHFDQVLIGSYGPFLKDVLDEGVRAGLDWKKYHPGFIFSAEGFSETFRDYVIRIAGLDNPYISTLNHYGTVDLGTMSYETPLAIFLRRLSISNISIHKTLFGRVTKLPTLTQYIPEHFYFESVDGNLLCSAQSGIPLVRYDLKDHGGVLSFSTLSEQLSRHSIRLTESTKTAHISETVWNLPFVYVSERSDFSVSFYAFQIYPETIKIALEQRKFEHELTGKFTLIVTQDKNANQQLEIHIETKPSITISNTTKKQISQHIIHSLMRGNAEYRKTREEFPTRTVPHLIFWPYHHPTHFGGRGKQLWIKKS